MHFMVYRNTVYRIDELQKHNTSVHTINTAAIGLYEQTM